MTFEAIVRDHSCGLWTNTLFLQEIHTYKPVTRPRDLRVYYIYTIRAIIFFKFYKFQTTLLGSKILNIQTLHKIQNLLVPIKKLFTFIIEQISYFQNFYTGSMSYG